jgi:hypothetical protein
MVESVMTRRPIDVMRDSAKTGRIGTDGDDSAISEMIPIGDTLFFVKEHGIYGMQLADQIDPGRTNAAVPDTQQKILSVGSNDPMVARTLLTAHTLFQPTVLGTSFDKEKGLRLALELVRDLVALTDMHADLEAAEAQARASFEAQQSNHGPIVLPAVGNLNARCDAFAQKAGHVVNILEDIAKLFYGDTLKSKWIDSLSSLAAQRYGEDSPFALFMRDIRPFLLFVRDMRNMIEHPNADRYVKVSDFRLLPSNEIALPAVEIVRPGEDAQKATIALLMKKITDDLVTVAEVLMAHLCGANARPFSGFPVGVVELPVEQRPNKRQRYFYGTLLGEQMVRFG